MIGLNSLIWGSTVKRALITVAFAALSQAGTIYDLTTSFSNTSNPNGVWSYVQGSTALAHFPQPTAANTLNPAAANGFFGAGNSFNVAPFIFETTQSGSATSPYTNNDFLAGDVLAHSTNPGTGAPLFIDWTSPGAGIITFSGEVWYAHSPVQRSNDYFVMLNGGPALASGTVSFNDGFNRSNPSMFSSGSITVAAGDVLALELIPSAGQTAGSLAGVDLSVVFTASTVPEPGTLPLAGALLGCIILGKFRRRLSAYGKR